MTASDGLLEALVRLLEGAELAPPERLPAVVASAGELLGVRATMYLVDYDQRTLVPPRHRSQHGQSGPEPLDVDSTLAGRAFQLVRTLPGDEDGEPTLWVPMLDGVERLGVLRVAPRAGTGLDDPALLTACRWLSGLTGHLVTIVNEYGPELDVLRLERPRTPAGQLIWGMLPPLTCGTDSFVLAGLLEPSHDVGGDAFDYSLSETTATLTIFDAVGHSMRSGLITAAALAADRAARSAGHAAGYSAAHGLTQRARAIDEAVAELFGHGTFVTGVLAELELHTGRLSYLIAGHPHPLVLRSGRIVKTLSGGHRLPFGFGTGVRPGVPDASVAEETLRPEDWLVLYTDGITEARDSSGEQFGEARLIGFLEREAAADNPPPETTRRLIHAVLDHHDGELQDDATVLLARWADRVNLLP